MEASVYNATGETVGTVALDDALFGITPNVAVMHQALVRQQANARHGTHDTKTRGEVRGGGRKPYRQKGTGRARQGSTRCAAVEGRRHRLGAASTQVHAGDAAQDAPTRDSLRALGKGGKCRRCCAGSISLEGRTRAMLALLGGLDNPRSTLVIVPERTENLLARRAISAM